MKNKSILCCWLFFAAFLLACNLLLPPISDDFYHELCCQKGFQGFIENYLTTNARFGQCLLCWFAGGMAPLAFDFLNTFIGVVFIYLLFVLIEGRRPQGRSDYGELSFLVVAILLFTMFGSVFLWTSGATNYLWGYVLIALHWIPYRLYWKNGNLKLNPWLWAPFFLLSLFAGWSSEQVGIMSILLHGCLLGYGLLILKKRFPLWVYLGAIFFAVGFLVLYFSPGIGARSADSDNYLGIPQLFSLGVMGMAKRCLLTLGWASSIKVFYVIPLFAKARFYLRIVLVICLSLISVYNLVRRKYTRLSLMYLFYFIALLSSIQILGKLPERAKFAQNMWLVAMGIYAIWDVFPSFFAKRYHIVLLVICSAFVLYCFYDYRENQKMVENLVNQAKIAGTNRVIIPAELYSSPYPNLGDWANPTDNSGFWLNRDCARYYGVNEFVVQ